MDKEMTLEQATDELELVIQRLENEALPMKESVDLYTRACQLLSFCMEAMNGYHERMDSAYELLSPYLSEEDAGHE